MSSSSLPLPIHPPPRTTMASTKIADPLAGMAHSEVHYFNRYPSRTLQSLMPQWNND